MKKALLIPLLGLCITSCSSNWEYKVFTVKGTKIKTSIYEPNKFEVTDESLNSLGKEGWELVDIYEIMETVHPNFGSDKYVTGMQPNVRTAEINFVFKRRK